MNKLIKQAQELQARMAKAQLELAEITVEASAGGGAVSVTADGQQNVKSVTISPEVVDPEDVEMLQDLVLAAVSETLAKSQEVAQKHMSSITGGLNLPGF
jgi:DNA-binding YbaB/EbfC family protein